MNNTKKYMIIAFLMGALFVLAGCDGPAPADNLECGECAQLSPPGPNFCPDGNIVGGGLDECGCQKPPVCDTNTACTEDAKICPDGTALSRDPKNNCAFPSCPGKIPADMRKYVANSEEECKTVLFQCIPGAEPFFDQSGCGCEATTYKDYKSKDLDECSRIRYTCPENYEAFTDAVGCGCKWSWDTTAVGGDAETYCQPEQRDQPCTKEYMPVCGWNGPNIQCIKYPCAMTYGNKCDACSDSNVEYWTPGECPVDPVMDKRTYCLPEQKGAEACTMEYRPVCGYTDEEALDDTFSNPCQACAQNQIAYWEDGACPGFDDEKTTNDAPTGGGSATGTLPEGSDMPDIPEYNTEDRVFCQPEDRNSNSCTEDLDVVCADNGETYKNGCQACSEETVTSWAPGECSGIFE